MVLSELGVNVEESQLRELSDCSPLGTDAFQLIEAARQLGFSHSRKHNLSSLNELSRLIDDGFFPVVYVDLWPINGGLAGQYHSLVVTSVEAESVVVLDPAEGERNLSRTEFLAAWAEMRFLTILIEQ